MIGLSRTFTLRHAESDTTCDAESSHTISTHQIISKYRHSLDINYHYNSHILSALNNIMNHACYTVAMVKFSFPLVLGALLIACSDDATSDGATANETLSDAGTSSGSSGSGANSSSGSSGTSKGSPSIGTDLGCPAIPSKDARVPAGLGGAYLNVHNRARARRCLQPLRWDDNLAAVAQAFAERGAGTLPGHNEERSAQYAARTGCTSDCPDVGENISWQGSWDYWPIEDMCQGWLEEEDPNACNEGGNHYTQMMLEGATHVGCGFWIEPENGDHGTRAHLVCNYLVQQGSGAPFPVANCSCSPPAETALASCEFNTPE